MIEKEFIEKIIETANDNTIENDNAIRCIRVLVNEYLHDKKTSPYIEEVTTIKRYNPKFGDDKKCKCGHSYVRHFNFYDEDDVLYGCKYCGCEEFVLD